MNPNIDFVKEIKNAASICRFDKKAVDEVSNKGNMIFAFIMILFSTILSFIGEVDVGTTFLNFIYLLMYVVAATFIMVGLIHLVAKLFGAKKSFKNMFLPFTYIFLIDAIYVFALVKSVSFWVHIIDFIWGISLIFMIIMQVYGFSVGKTIGLIFTIFGMLVGVTVVISLIAAFGMMAFGMIPGPSYYTDFEGVPEYYLMVGDSVEINDATLTLSSIDGSTANIAINGINSVLTKDTPNIVGTFVISLDEVDDGSVTIRVKDMREDFKIFNYS